MCGGDGQVPAVISCKGCVCGLAVCNIIFALLGLLFSAMSQGFFMDMCTGSAYSGGYGLLAAGGEESTTMSILHGLKDQGHLEVGGFLEGFSDMEAMRPPFLAPTKPPSRAAQVLAARAAPARAAPSAAAKPKFMDHVSKNALLATCANPFATLDKGDTQQWDSDDAMGLMKFVINTQALQDSGLTAGSISGFRIRGYPSDGTETFKNFQAGLKAVTISVPDASQLSARDSDKYTAEGDMTLNNENSWTELTLASPFSWDGSKNIEIALFHATGGTGSQKTATSSYSWAKNGLTTKTYTTYDSSRSDRLLYASHSSTPSGVTATTWATIPQPIFNSHQAIASWIPQIEFVTSGCTSKNLASCTSESCAQCLARADCSFKKSSSGTSTACVKTSDSTYSSYEDVTECPAGCSSFKACHECRSADSGECYWAQAQNADETGDYSGSCGDEYISSSENTTHRTNSSCQSPEASNALMAACKATAQLYMPGYIGYFFLLIGATLQLLGVCSWCGVKKEARSNVNLLCSGCNIHWIAGLVLLIWGMIYLMAYSAALSLFFVAVAAYLLPCLIAPCAGIIGLVSICPSKTCAGPMPTDQAAQVPVQGLNKA